MGKSGIRLISFDLDGTLLDTSPGIWHTMERTARELGFSRVLTAEEKSRFVGPPLKDGFSIVYNLDGTLLNKAVDLYREIYKEEGIKMYSYYPGLENVLLSLRKRGYILTVSTLKDERAAKSLIASTPFSSLFSAIHGSDPSLTMGKSGILSLSLREFDVRSSQAVLVGDSESDEKGAAALSVPFVAVSWGFGFPYGLPEPCAEKPEELEEIILSMDKGSR